MHFLLLALLLLMPVSDDITFERRTLTHDGRERYFLLYAPVDNSEPVPLVFLLHGGGGNPERYEDMTGFAEIAREEGFILVYPAGTGPLEDTLLTWNAGHCCAYAVEENVDDVGFFRRMVADLQAEFNIDPARIYTAGHSNGAIMSYRLAAEMSDTFAAAGIVAGTIGGSPSPRSRDSYIIPQPENPVSILHIHGMEDESLLYDGGVNRSVPLGRRRDDLPVAESIAFWVEANGCDTVPESVSQDDGMVLIDTYTCPTTTVQLISIVDGGHSWPGGDAPRRRSDPPSQRVDASAELWAFFAAHPKEQ